MLPVAALLDQYKATDSILVKHFDLVYVQQSLGRLDLHERRSLLPTAIKGISSDASASKASLFNVILRLLHDIKLPPRGSKDDEALRDNLGLSDAKDAQVIAEWLTKLMLLRVRTQDPTAPSPGLTAADVDFLTLGKKPETWDPAANGLNLSETVIKALGFLASGAFTDRERFIPAVYAASSSNSRIAGIGDDILKRTSVSLEDKELVKTLFDAHENLPNPYKIRILGFLSKSEIATTFTDEILQVWGMVRGGTAVATRLEMTKLHRSLFEFINWVARIGPTKTDFNKVAVPLIDLLRGFFSGEGWPKPQNQSLDDIALRSRAYETIGVLAKASKLSREECLSLAGWLFRSLSEDPTPEVVFNIEGALSGLTSAYKPARLGVPDIGLPDMLLTYFLQPVEGDVVRSARHAATKWANRCLPFSNVQARWIDIMAIAGRPDERNDVIEEGHKGLDPWTYYANESKSRTLPDWREMVRTFFRDPISHINSKTWLSGASDAMDIDQKPFFTNFPGQSIAAFPVALNYCKRMFFLTALKNFKFEPGWEQHLETLVNSDLVSRQAIKEYSSSLLDMGQLNLFLAAAFEGMLDEKIAEESARCFVDVASLVPMVVLAPLVSRSAELRPLVTSNRKEIRVLGAKAFGILCAHPSNTQSSIADAKSTFIVITKNLKTAVGSDLNAVEGAFLALAHLSSRLVYYQTLSDVSDIEHGDVFPPLSAVSSASLSTQEALFDSYSQLWTAGHPTGPKDKNASELVSYVKEAFVEPLTVQAKKGNEKAITALGRLALAAEGPECEAIVSVILEKLFALYEIKQAEVHFAVGEAITAAIARWDSEVVQLTIDVEAHNGSWRKPKRPEKLTSVLEKLLTDVKTTKPSLMKASGIWLFCLIQYCSHLDEVRTRLRECQAAFMRLLSARDELVQETASRGLSLVYEKGDSAHKGELVRDLVSSFTGTGPQLKVDEETELFEAGALPTGEGKSITSYKDIVSLANEVGDQSLVYKFMSLATNAATWSTRSAFGRFGLSSILSESEIDPKLYPKLYRYRFDPNTNVQKSMNDIWKALVKDPGAVLETHFDDIIRDLLKCILGKEWRVREASCAAISDLISGRPFPKYEPYYKDIWAAALKVLDDVKATVRNAALHLCIALSTTLVRQLEESGTTAAATAMMNEALPFLMSEKGIESGVEDVKVFSTITVIKIAKSGGKSLNPYIPTMVSHLLGLLSTIEPEAINYHYQRAGEDRKETIDKLRSSMVSRSPISEAIENCLRSVDSAVMSKLAPGLEEAIKAAVGMPTKIGCGRVLSTLATRHANDLRPYSARFLQLMEKQILDRNDQVSQGYARAAAYLIRVVPDDAKQKFAGRLRELYLGSEDESRRQKVADAVLALSKISPDHFAALEGQLLPFSFLGKHDTDEYVQKAFDEVWSKHAGSSLTVTRYIPEIVDLVQRSLDTAQWALKHAGALAIASAVASISSASDLSGQVNIGNLKAVWPVYEKSLALKTFPGKEKLLDPFPDFVAKSKGWWEKDKTFAEQLKKIAIREAKRNNDDYRPHAFRCLWRFAASRDDTAMLPEISKIVTPYLDLTNEDDDAMDVDKPSKNDRARGLDQKSRVAWAAMEAVAKGYNRAKLSEKPLVELGEIASVLEENASSKGGLNLEHPYIGKQEFDAIRRAYWYACVAELLEVAVKSEAKADGKGLEVLKWYVATLDLERADMGTEEQRLARTKAVIALLELWKKHSGSGGSGMDDTGRLVKAAVEKALKEERSLDVQTKWKACLQMLG